MRFIGILILCLWLVPTRSLPAAQTPDLVGASTQFGPIAVTQNGTIFTYAPSVPGFISYLTKIAADGTSQVVRLPSGLMNEIIAFGSDHAGNLYFTTPNGGSVVFPAALTINKMAADGSLSIVAQLDLPGAGESSAVGSGQSSFSVDGTGNCYYYNMLTGLIKKISPNGNINTLKNLSMIYQLSRISVDNFGNIYGLTFPGAQIIKISSDGNISTFFPGSPPKFGNFLAVDSIGDVYTFTGSDGNLTEVTPDGTAVSLDVVGLTGSNSSRISGIVVDADDTLYVASNNASQTPLNAIGERTRDGRIHLLTPSRINGPSGLAVDIGGMVYVANQHDGTISRISPDGTISTFAANLHRPSGLAFDTSGILYVADYASNSIKK